MPSFSNLGVFRGEGTAEFDLDLFGKWLLNKGLCKEYVKEIMRYVKSFGVSFLSGDVRAILGMSDAKRRMCLASISNLARFLGRHRDFKEIVENFGLTYGNSVKSEDAFLRLYGVRNLLL